MAPHLAPFAFYIELIFSLIVTMTCFVIYHKTKELYILSKHKGIEYFRKTFLFFGIAFLARFFLRSAIVILPRGAKPIFLRMNPWMGTISFIVSYASTMALIYLIYSIYYKKINKNILKKTYIIHAFAITIALSSMFFHNKIIMLILQFLLFILFGIISLKKYRNTKKNTKNLFLVYLAIIGLWIISNILEVLSFFTPVPSIIIYTISIIIFAKILDKVLKSLTIK